MKNAFAISFAHSIAFLRGFLSQKQSETFPFLLPQSILHTFFSLPQADQREKLKTMDLFWKQNSTK